MVRAFQPLKANVGRSRIGASIPANFANPQRQVRSQFQAILREYYRWTRHMDTESVEVLKEALEPTFQKSQQIVPYKDGDLMASGYLETRTFRGKATVEIGYARGGKPEYAVRQHEDLELNHPNGGQAKFLERPLADDANDIQARVIQGMRKASGV